MEVKIYCLKLSLNTERTNWI